MKITLYHPSKQSERMRESRDERKGKAERERVQAVMACQGSRAPVRSTQAQLALRWPVVSLSARAAWWSRHRGNWQLGFRAELEQLSESTHLRTTQALHYQLFPSPPSHRSWPFFYDYRHFLILRLILLVLLLQTITKFNCHILCCHFWVVLNIQKIKIIIIIRFLGFWEIGFKCVLMCTNY